MAAKWKKIRVRFKVSGRTRWKVLPETFSRELAQHPTSLLRFSNFDISLSSLPVYVWSFPFATSHLTWSFDAFSPSLVAVSTPLIIFESKLSQTDFNSSEFPPPIRRVDNINKVAPGSSGGVVRSYQAGKRKMKSPGKKRKLLLEAIIPFPKHEFACVQSNPCTTLSTKQCSSAYPPFSFPLLFAKINWTNETAVLVVMASCWRELVDYVQFKKPLPPHKGKTNVYVDVYIRQLFKIIYKSHNCIRTVEFVCLQ